MKIGIPNFTGNIHIQGKALMKLAKLTSENDEQKAQEAYTKLSTLSKSHDYDLMIKLNSQDSIVVTKLNPLTEDAVELACNNDFVQGIKEAIETLESEDIDLQQKSFASDLNRHRIISQMRNIR